MRKPHSISHFQPSHFLRLGVEKTGRQITNISRHGVNEETVDDTVQDVDDIQQDIGAKATDGARITSNQFLHHPECFICSDAEKMGRPMASDFDDLTRS